MTENLHMEIGRYLMSIYFLRVTSLEDVKKTINFRKITIIV